MTDNTSRLTQAQIDTSYERHCVPTNPYAPSRKYWGRAMQSGFDLAHASPPSQPIASDLERECADTDKLLAMLGLDADACRTVGGSLNLAKIRGLLTPAVTNEMVTRFLGWKLPKDFSPDCGISFDRISNKGNAYESVREPVGTNLLSADQVRAMLEHVIGAAQPIASDVVAAPDPVAWFQNNAAEGQPPHYSQIAAKYIGTEGTFPLYRGSRRSSVEDESHQSTRNTQPPKNCELCHGEGFMFNAICTPESCGYYADHVAGETK